MSNYFLSESDVEVLKRLIQRERNTPVNAVNRPHQPEQDYQTPEVHVALVPVGGIPPRVGTAPGTASCKIYRTTGTTPALVELVSQDKTVLNMSEETLTPGSYVPIAREKFGRWVALINPEASGSSEPTPDDCCPSVNLVSFILFSQTFSIGTLFDWSYGIADTEEGDLIVVSHNLSDVDGATLTWTPSSGEPQEFEEILPIPSTTGLSVFSCRVGRASVGAGSIVFSYGVDIDGFTVYGSGCVLRDTTGIPWFMEDDPANMGVIPDPTVRKGIVVALAVSPDNEAPSGGYFFGADPTQGVVWDWTYGVNGVAAGAHVVDAGTTFLTDSPFLLLMGTISTYALLMFDEGALVRAFVGGGSTT